MGKWVRNNSLGLAAFFLFLFTLVGQVLAGRAAHNEDQRDHGEPPVGLVEYLGTGHFGEATLENWESEFLQMAAFVVLTTFLRQKGSPESKKLDGKEPVDADPRRARRKKDAPWPVRRGGPILKLYEHSLSIALSLLFIASFALHAAGGVSEYNQEQLAHGGETVSLISYIGTARFWFESFQNWQSEFLSVGVLIVLSIFLRQRGSLQSKPVASSHGETGESKEASEQDFELEPELARPAAGPRVA